MLCKCLSSPTDAAASDNVHRRLLKHSWGWKLLRDTAGTARCCFPSLTIPPSNFSGVHLTRRHMPPPHAAVNARRRCCMPPSLPAAAAAARRRRHCRRRCRNTTPPPHTVFCILRCENNTSDAANAAPSRSFLPAFTNVTFYFFLSTDVDFLSVIYPLRRLWKIRIAR